MLLLILLLAYARILQEYKIQLDGSHYSRYIEPAKDLKDATIKFMNDLFSVLNKPFAQKIKEAYSNVKHYFPQKAQEIMGIAATLEVSEEDMFVYQYIYEIYTYCTTIIARDAADHILVGRNLDYMFLKDLADTHYIAVFTLQGNEMFRCTHYGGFVGANTCTKRGKYTVTLNSRNSVLDTNRETNLQELGSGATLVTWAILDAFNYTSSYDQAVNYLSSVHIAAPAYYNVGGITGNQGCVINRERSYTYSTCHLTESNWYIVQVNTDFDTPIPSKTIDRRTPAQNKLNSIENHNVTVEDLMDILSAYPNNNNMTIYTAIIDANRDYFNITFWA